MNAFNRETLSADPEGFLESCDNCNAFIFNWHWMSQSFVAFDGRILCKRCRLDKQPDVCETGE